MPETPPLPPLLQPLKDKQRRVRKVTQTLTNEMMVKELFDPGDPGREGEEIEHDLKTGERKYKILEIPEDFLNKVPKNLRDIILIFNDLPYISIRKVNAWKNLGKFVLQFALLKEHPFSNQFIENLLEISGKSRPLELVKKQTDVVAKLREFIKKKAHKIIPKDQKLTLDVSKISLDENPFEQVSEEEKLWELHFNIGTISRILPIGRNEVSADVQAINDAIKLLSDTEIEYLIDSNRPGLKIHIHALGPNKRLKVYRGTKVPEKTKLNQHVNKIVNLLNQLQFVSTRSSSGGALKIDKASTSGHPQGSLLNYDTLNAPYIDFTVLKDSDYLYDQLAKTLKAIFSKDLFNIIIPDDDQPAKIGDLNINRHEELWRIEGKLDDVIHYDKINAVQRIRKKEIIERFKKIYSALGKIVEILEQRLVKIKGNQTVPPFKKNSAY